MNPNKLTTKAQEALQAMQQIAQARGHQALEPEHLLLALLQSSGADARILHDAGITRDKVLQVLDPAEVAAMCDEVLVMERGRFVRRRCSAG